MKINDIIECMNQTLDSKRSTMSDPSNAFFTIRKTIDRKMGPIKVFTTYIEFHNGEENYLVYKDIHTCRSLEGQEGDKWEELDKETIKQLMNLMVYGEGKLSWDKFVTGEFHGIE